MMSHIEIENRIEKPLGPVTSRKTHHTQATAYLLSCPLADIQVFQSKDHVSKAGPKEH